MALSMNQVSALGQTTAGSSEADLIAMNAPDSELPGLCRAGNLLACQLAKIPQSTPEELAARARERDRQAAAEREHTARKLESAGVSPRIAQAVRDQQDVIYASSYSPDTGTYVPSPYVPYQPRPLPRPRYLPASIGPMPGWAPYVLGGLAAIGLWMAAGSIGNMLGGAK